jgi:4-amino-4-deoxy-L-arabinose transferase-like glycosyltransferase
VTRRYAWAWWWSAACSVRAAVAFGLLGAMPMTSDARDYFDVGAALASGKTEGAFYWPPGEGAALGAAFRAFGTSVAVARTLTIAMSVATVVLTARIARDLAGARAGNAAGWIAALYAPSVLLCGQSYAQHLAALCLAATAFYGLRAARDGGPLVFVAAGVALGLGILTRPSMGSVVPVLAVAWGGRSLREPTGAGRRRATWGAAIGAVAALACVTPAYVHDARAGAGWTLSTNNERNLFLGNNPYTPDYKTSHLGQRALGELEPEARDYLTSFYRRADARAAMQREALSYMEMHPARTTLRTLNRTTSFWGFDYLASRSIQNWRGWGPAVTLPLLALEGGSYLVVAALALVALFAMRGHGDRGGRAWLVALAVAYEVPYALAFSGGTYHFPVFPVLVALAAIAAAHPRQAWHDLRNPRQCRGAWAALAGFALLQAQYGYYAVAMK